MEPGEGGQAGPGEAGRPQAHCHANQSARVCCFPSTYQIARGLLRQPIRSGLIFSACQSRCACTAFRQPTRSRLLFSTTHLVGSVLFHQSIKLYLLYSANLSGCICSIPPLILLNPALFGQPIRSRVLYPETNHRPFHVYPKIQLAEGWLCTCSARSRIVFWKSLLGCGLWVTRGRRWSSR